MGDKADVWEDNRSWSEVLDGTWSRLSHAYGPADDTPQHLRALMDGDAQARRAAESHLVSAIIHQGTPWSATYQVVLFVTDLLNDPEMTASIAPSREGMLDFLAEVADFLQQFSADDWEELRKMANAAVHGFSEVIDWSEIATSEKLTNAYHSQAALAISKLEPRVLACLGEDMRGL